MGPKRSHRAGNARNKRVLKGRYSRGEKGAPGACWSLCRPYRATLSGHRFPMASLRSVGPALRFGPLDLRFAIGFSMTRRWRWKKLRFFLNFGIIILNLFGTWDFEFVIFSAYAQCRAEGLPAAGRRPIFRAKSLKMHRRLVAVHRQQIVDVIKDNIVCR